mgnify:CR=1 FL=1|jgi:hypothetical protein
MQASKASVDSIDYSDRYQFQLQNFEKVLTSPLTGRYLKATKDMALKNQKETHNGKYKKNKKLGHFRK